MSNSKFGDYKIRVRGSLFFGWGRISHQGGEPGDMWVDGGNGSFFHELVLGEDCASEFCHLCATPAFAAGCGFNYGFPERPVHGID